MANLKIQSALIVDESPFYAKILRQLLHAFEIPQIVAFHTYKEAMNLLQSKPFDVVLIDWQLEGRDKLKIISTIRKGHGTCDPNIPIILCTAHTRLSKITYARDIGVTEILVKPLSPDQLMAKLLSAYNHNRGFVETDNYAGPCRRRKDRDYYGDDRRGRASLDQNQVDEIMAEEGEE